MAVCSPSTSIPHEQLQLASRLRTAVAFVGWLSNAADLLPGESSLRPRESSEADIVLSAYEQLGVEMLSRLRGRFAVVIWDGNTDTVVAAHDPVGLHPLFWADADTGLWFSSSTDALLSCPGVCADLNRAFLADHLRYNYPDQQETWFKAIRKIPPAHALHDRGGSRRLIKTWTLASVREAGWISDEEAEQFEVVFEGAVRRCFQRGQAAISLSGGIDSVSVGAFAAELAEAGDISRPLALSLVFPGGASEERIQRSAAEQLRFPLVIAKLEDLIAPYDVLEAAMELATEWPFPMLNPWGAPYLALRKLGMEHGCKVVVTGSGGDEWLGVTPYLAADLLAKLDLPGLAGLMRAAKSSYDMPTWILLRNYLWKFGLRALIGRRILPLVSPPMVRRYDRRRLANSTPEWLAPDPALRREMTSRFTPRPREVSFYDKELRMTFENPLISMEFEDVFEEGRRLGAPVISPFWDVELIELLYRIPPSKLNSGGRSKGLVRWTLDERFPSLAFASQKKVNALPYYEGLLKNQGELLWKRYGPAAALAELGIVEEKGLESVVEKRLADGTMRQRNYLFQLQCTEMFARSYLN